MTQGQRPYRGVNDLRTFVLGVAGGCLLGALIAWCLL